MVGGLETADKGRAYHGAIAIYGAAGRFGGLLVRRLHRTDEVVSIDPRSFVSRPSDVEHHETDLRRKDCQDLFRRHRVQAVVHLGRYNEPLRTGLGEDSFATAVENFARLLEYCDQYHVRKLVLLSSADVYGARPRNPQFLTEEAPLLAAGLSALRDIDMMAQSFFWKRPDVETVILRTAHIAGGVNSLMARYLRMSPVPRVMGYDPMVQFVHEEDVVRSIRLALGPGHRGVFNIAGPQPVPLSRVIERLGRSSLPVPHIVARPMLAQLHRLGKIEMHPSYIDYVRYVCMVDDSRARQELGYRPLKEIGETISAIDVWQ